MSQTVMLIAKTENPAMCALESSDNIQGDYFSRIKVQTLYFHISTAIVLYLQRNWICKCQLGINFKSVIA